MSIGDFDRRLFTMPPVLADLKLLRYSLCSHLIFRVTHDHIVRFSSCDLCICPAVIVEMTIFH